MSSSNTQTSIYNRIEQAAFTVLAMHYPVSDGAADIAERIAGFATAAALSETITALYDIGAFSAVVAFEDAAREDMDRSRPCWSASDHFEMWGASVGAKHELEEMEDVEPKYDPDDRWC